MNYVSNEKELVDIYNAVDLYVTPSLQDNLPNTIVEAMACGIPCVGFNVGGIPQMIDHLHNGYVARYKSAEESGQRHPLGPHRRRLRNPQCRSQPEGPEHLFRNNRSPTIHQDL